MSTYLISAASVESFQENLLGFASDWNNALKLGFDVKQLSYPDWMTQMLASVGVLTHVLPSVVQPGAVIGKISPFLSQRYSINPECKIVAGNKLIAEMYAQLVI